MLHQPRVEALGLVDVLLLGAAAAGRVAHEVAAALEKRERRQEYNGSDRRRGDGTATI